MGITIIRRINSAIDRLLIAAERRVGAEHFGIEGVIKVHELGDMTPEEYAYWWLPEKDADGRLLRLTRLSRQEKERFQVAEFNNLITNAGKQALLTYVGSQSNNSLPWGQGLNIGNGAIAQVSASDTAVVGLLYQTVFSASTIVGTQVDLNILFGGTSGNGLWTNVGIVGGGFSATLYTHALANYNKVTGFVGVDYLINIY